MPFSYCFLKNDVCDAFGRIDLGQRTRGVRHLHASGGIGGQRAQHVLQIDRQRVVLPEQLGGTAFDRYSALWVWWSSTAAANGTRTLPIPTAHNSARVEAPARHTTRSAQQ